MQNGVKMSPNLQNQFHRSLVNTLVQFKVKTWQIDMLIFLFPPAHPNQNKPRVHLKKNLEIVLKHRRLSICKNKFKINPLCIYLCDKSHQSLLTFEYNNVERARSRVAGVIAEGVRHLSGTDGEERSRGVGPGGEGCCTAVVGGSWLCPGYSCAAYSAVDGAGDVIDAGDGWRDGID